MRQLSSEALPPIVVRVVLSLVAPVGIALIISRVILNLLPTSNSGVAFSSLFLGLTGLISWFMGLRWYGLKEMGIRGGRPLFSSSGFAFMGWVAVLIIRFLFVQIDETRFLQQTLWQDFFYLLLFEAFAVNIWLFGLVFRSVSELRGGVTASIVSGIIFGGFAYIIFLESFQEALTPIIYFLFWGIFYGVIRLRTGSWLGLVIVQAMQSLTAWFLFPPILPANASNFNSFFYIYMTIWFLLLIWRLWPKEIEDYRI